MKQKLLLYKDQFFSDLPHFINDKNVLLKNDLKTTPSLNTRPFCNEDDC